jgi:hypothetical protein
MRWDHPVRLQKCLQQNQHKGYGAAAIMWAALVAMSGIFRPL